MALRPDGSREAFKILLVDGRRDDHEAPITLIAFPVDSIQHPVESIDDLLEAVFVGVAVDGILLHRDAEQPWFGLRDRLADGVQQFQAQRARDGVVGRTRVRDGSPERRSVELHGSRLFGEVPGLKPGQLFGEVVGLPLKEREARHHEVASLPLRSCLVHVQDVHERNVAG